MPAAHADFLRFFQVLSDAALFTSWSGNVVRQSAPRWLSEPFRFTGAGALLAGGRWTVQRLMPTVYASTEPDTLLQPAPALEADLKRKS